jgi:hypothetical protein
LLNKYLSRFAGFIPFHRGSRAPACCKIGFKWYLFAFYDFGEVLGFAVFAVTAFLEPAEML